MGNDNIVRLPLEVSFETLVKRMDRIEQEYGGTSGGGNMEARIANLEASVSHIEKDISMIFTELSGIRKDMREDFRVGIGFTIVAILGLAGLMAKGFHWF